MSQEEEIWKSFRSLTDARIALGRSGGSLKTEQMLAFRKDHAMASDAVAATLDDSALIQKLEEMGLQTLSLQSQASDRRTYVQRPDLGRTLHENSIHVLESLPAQKFDMNVVISDGLSPLAISHHAVPFLEAFLPKVSAYKLAPVSIVTQGRVAISDPIGELIGSDLSIVLIGERPGLTSPYSMGIYMTYQPKSGNTDEKRNCISNIREDGLSYDYAASKLSFLVSESLRRKLSGVDLKDTFDDKLLKNDEK